MKSWWATLDQPTRQIVFVVVSYMLLVNIGGFLAAFAAGDFGLLFAVLVIDIALGTMAFLSWVAHRLFPKRD